MPAMPAVERDTPSLRVALSPGDTSRYPSSGTPASTAFGATIDRIERPRPTNYRRFVLGVVDQSSSATAPVIRELDAKGPASRAGLRANDVLKSLHYAPGDAETKVHLEIERGGKALTIDYLPAGPKRRGIAWQRRPGVADELCVR